MKYKVPEMGYAKEYGDRSTAWVAASKDGVFVQFERPAKEDDPEENVLDEIYTFRFLVSHEAFDAMVLCAADALYAMEDGDAA